jgi:hypothetical protein
VATVDRTCALILGSPVLCEDGSCGELSSLVIGATTLRLTDLVVGGDVEPARVVPYGLISKVRPDAVEVSCTAASIKGFEAAETAKVLDVSDDTGGWGLVSVIYATDSAADTYLRMRERVMASDGAVGRVHGCRIDAEGWPGQLTSLLVDVGHAGEQRLVEVAARAITSMKGMVVLDMSRQTARELPSVDL